MLPGAVHVLGAPLVPAPLTEWEVEAWRLAERLRGADSLLDFVTLLSPTFERPDHLKQVAEMLARAEHEPVRGLISMPPRHGKTELILAAMVWWLFRDPRQTIGYVSHTAPFACGRSERARTLAQYCGLQPGSIWRTDEWRVWSPYPGPQGGVVAVGIDGNLIGKGLNKFVIDDPFKGRPEAESPTIRETIWDRFVGTVIPRLEPLDGLPGSAFVVHTRWHDDDLIGRLEKQTEVKWERINLPAIDENNRALWPSKWPWAALDERRREVGPFEWAAQYTGHPVPKGGRIFGEPARYVHPDAIDARIVIGCDPAAGGSATSDYSAIVVLAIRGVGINTTVDVLDVWREQCQVSVLVKKLVEYQKHWNARIVVEAVGGFKAVPQMLRSIDPSMRIFEVHPLGSKHDRAQPIAAAWNDVPGRVRVPVEAPWLKAFLDEVCSFTGVKDAHDDQVDALSHAFNIGVRLIEPGQRGPAVALYERVGPDPVDAVRQADGSWGPLR